MHLSYHRLPQATIVRNTDFLFDTLTNIFLDEPTTGLFKKNNIHEKKKNNWKELSLLTGSLKLQGSKNIASMSSHLI
jgi:hypothetical protein